MVVLAEGPVLEAEVRVRVDVEVADTETLLPLAHPPDEALEARVRDVVITAQDHGPPAALHDLLHPAHHRPGCLHDVGGVDVEVADVHELEVILQSKGDAGVHVDPGVLHVRGEDAAGHLRRLTDGPRTEPRAGLGGDDALVDGDSGHDRHPLAHGAHLRVRRLEEGRNPRISRVNRMRAHSSLLDLAYSAPSPRRASSIRRASSRMSPITRRLRSTKGSDVSMSTVRGRASGTWISSRIRPGRAVMTKTRSPRNSASSMSCVTKSTVFAVSPQTRSRSSPMRDRVWAS